MAGVTGGEQSRCIRQLILTTNNGSGCHTVKSTVKKVERGIQISGSPLTVLTDKTEKNASDFLKFRGRHKI